MNESYGDLRAKIDAALSIHHPLYEDDVPVGCAACDWDQPQQDVWLCPTALALTGSK